MAIPPSRIIPRVALVTTSTPNTQHRRRLALTRIDDLVTGLDVPIEVSTNNNNRTGTIRIFVSVVRQDDQLRSAPVDPVVSTTRRFERLVNEPVTVRIDTRGGEDRGRRARRAERELEEEEDDDDEDRDYTPERSARRRGRCDHDHALEKRFCSKCHIRRRHLSRWWWRQQYRRQV